MKKVKRKMALTDIYLFRWNPWTFLLLIIVLAAWLWRVDRDMKNRGKPGLFSMEDLWG